GFDCVPANTLLDLWCERSSGRPFDADGAAAARGVVDARLLDALLAEPYFALAPPSSTGPDHFNASWHDARLDVADARARLPPEGGFCPDLADSGRKARAAAAGRRRVRVLDHELGALQVVLVVDLGPGEVLQAHRIDEQRDAVLGHRRVVVVDDLVEGEAVLE